MKEPNHIHLISSVIRKWVGRCGLLSLMACLSCARDSAGVVSVSDVSVCDVSVGFDWCYQGGIKQDLGAYQHGLSIVQITRTFGALGNPDFIGWMDEKMGTCGISKRPTGNNRLFPNPGGNVTFDSDGYVWYTYGGRSQDLAFDLFRSVRPHDVKHFKLLLDDFVSRQDDGSTSIRVFTARNKVMLQWRQFGSTVSVVRARHRRYEMGDLSRYENQVDIGAGLPNICIEQVWSRYDPRFDYLISSFHFFQLSPRVMGSAPYLYSTDQGTTWRMPNGKICPRLPLDYPTASSLRIIPWDHIKDQQSASWIEFESGVSPRGIPWMICPTGAKMSGRFFLWNDKSQSWENTLDIGPIKGRLAGFSGGATKNNMVFVYANDAQPNHLQAVVSADDGATWSPPFLIDKLNDGDLITWVAYCQPSTSYEDNCGRFFYAYHNRRSGNSSHNRIKFVRFKAGRGTSSPDQLVERR